MRRPSKVSRRAALLTAATACLGLAAVPAATAAEARAAKPGPFYWIISVSSGKALMPYEHSQAAQAPLVQSIQGNYGAQHWKIEGAGNLRVLRNRHSKHCIMASLKSGGILRQFYCRDYWDQEPNSATRETWIPSSYDDMWAGKPITWMSYYGGLGCITAYGAGAVNKPCDGSVKQQFRLVHVPGT
ncbi:RICIN domain-containing protein [Actinomadura kijaniata]|uniref:RICIN domain-containing protein n=1 Tax=Actinomadura kijaniata TaxID=46161 RepID=UPI003F1DC2D2